MVLCCSSRWIFNVIHGIFVGAGAEILSGNKFSIGQHLKFAVGCKHWLFSHQS